MIKAIINKLLPSNAKLAKKAAATIQKEANSATDATKTLVAKYATLGNECAQIAANLTEMLKDGNIDDMETETLAAYIEPLIAKAREISGV